MPLGTQAVEQAARIAADGLDLHHVDAPVGQDASSRRSGHPHSELHHPDTFQRPRYERNGSGRWASWTAGVERNHRLVRAVTDDGYSVASS